MSLSLALLSTIVAGMVIILIVKNTLQLKSKRGESRPISLPPFPIPFWKNAFLLWSGRKSLWEFISGLGEHGKVHGIHVRSINARVVLINDYVLAKELFASPIFSARPTNDVWQYYAKGNYGIITSSGKVWEEQRRYNVQKLKDLGVGNKSMEGLIAMEVEDFIQTLNKLKGKVIAPNHLTAIPILNTLWVILSGQRMKDGHSEESRIIHKVYEVLRMTTQPPYIFFVLSNYPKFITNFVLQLLKTWPFTTFTNNGVAGFDNFRNFCTKFVATRREALNAGQHSGSFIDAYLDEINSTTNPQSTFYKDQGVMNLHTTITDLIIAGGDTTANTLVWAILHLIRNPEIQLKIQTHLDRVVGRDRPPILSDIPNLPYIMAFLLEVLRVTPVAIAGIPHRVTDDVIVEGYLIKKNSLIIFNAAAIHSDPSIWGDPENFRPERFLSPNGEKVVQNEAMIAFSVGKRQCPGRRLAMDNLFLFVSSMCQKYNLRQDPNLQGIPPLASEPSFIFSPKEFFVLIEDREL